MKYTPFSNSTDGELILNVCNDPAASAREIELIARITYWKEEAEDLRRELYKAEGYTPQPATVTRYVEAT